MALFSLIKSFSTSQKKAVEITQYAIPWYEGQEERISKSPKSRPLSSRGHPWWCSAAWGRGVSQCTWCCFKLISAGFPPPPPAGSRHRKDVCRMCAGVPHTLFLWHVCWGMTSHQLPRSRCLGCLVLSSTYESWKAPGHVPSRSSPPVTQSAMVSFPSLPLLFWTIPRTNPGSQAYIIINSENDKSIP